VNAGGNTISRFHIVADQNAKSLRNLGLMWMQSTPSDNTETVNNLLKAARLVPDGNNTRVGTPLVLAEVSDDNRVYDFDGYMTDEKINGCYLVSDANGGTMINRVTSYFSNAFSYSIVFDQKENNALTSSVSDDIQTTFLVKVSNLGTSTINRCVLSVENVNDSIPLHVVVPPGMTAQERVTIPFKSGMAKKNFLADLQKQKDAKLGTKLSVEELSAFKHARADALTAPIAGQVYYEFSGEGACEPCLEPFVGQQYKEGDTFCYIQAPWGEIVPIPAALGGKLVEVAAKQGAKVRRGDNLGWIERC
jgi:biotin carboxyl carrier protein